MKKIIITSQQEWDGLPDKMDEYTVIEIRMAERKELPGNVPCNGCTLCCHGDAIRILPQDDPSQYETVPHDHFKGHLMLAHKENGDCIYLGNEGCSIHHCKPQMCKEMDCRKLAKSIKKRDLKKYSVKGVLTSGYLEALL